MEQSSAALAWRNGFIRRYLRQIKALSNKISVWINAGTHVYEQKLLIQNKLTV